MEYIGIYSAVNDLSMLAASRGRPVTQQPTSQLVHHLILCMVVIVKLKEVRKVSDFHTQANLENPPHGRQVYEAQRRPLCSLLSTSKTSNAMLYLKVTRTYLWRSGWRILVSLGVGIHSTIQQFVARKQECSLSRFRLKSSEVVHNKYSCSSADKYTQNLCG